MTQNRQNKKNRQAKIIELVQSRDIETQEELADELRKADYEVTQATVSRDIRELNLSKVTGDNGRQHYIIIKQDKGTSDDKYIRVLKDGFASAEVAQNILVIKTVSGMAMAVAAALDNLQFAEIVGCIAGDDTIFAAIRTSEEAVQLRTRLLSMVGHTH